MDREKFAESHLGFRIVSVKRGDVDKPVEEAQYQRLNEEGKVLHIAPASMRELAMWRLLITPEKEWG